jgi:hypothetical protein
MLEVRRGPQPFAAFQGDGEDVRVVVAGMTPWWRARLKDLADEDFPRPDWLKSYMLESLLRRGVIERCGYHRGGRWYYRLTLYGAALKAAA